MHLSPLQSRLAASVTASCLLLGLYILLFTPQLALAADVDSPDLTVVSHADDPSNIYEADFPLFNRDVTGHTPRQTETQIIPNNQLQNTSLAAGDTKTYQFTPAGSSSRSSAGVLELRGLPDDAPSEADESSDEELDKRQQSDTLYISANTCVQPVHVAGKTTPEPPQLTLYVSTSSDNTTPGPDQDDSTQSIIAFNEGAVMHKAPLDGDVYFSVVAPTFSTEDFSAESIYNIQVAASTVKFYHYYDDDDRSNLVYLDSDDKSTLLTTTDIENVTLESPLPYNMFVQNQNNTSINGMKNSFCGLAGNADFRSLYNGDSPIETSLHTWGDGTIRQEFYLDGLNPNSNYSAFLVREPDQNAQGKRNSDHRGGGSVFRATQFDTKPTGACNVIYNLTLCSNLRYAVPGNTDLFPTVKDLANFYDNYTQTMFNSFEKSLAQIPCEAPPDQQYSLATNCTVCKEAYKDWLCTVAIPRCVDFSEPHKDYFQIRNINEPFPNGSLASQELRDTLGKRKAFSSSRNPAIDETVKPGPYKELLPCDNVCYSVVRKCPSALGFSCPLPHMIGYNTTYAKRDKSQESEDVLTCNFQGSGYWPSASSQLLVPWIGMAGLLFAALSLTI